MPKRPEPSQPTATESPGEAHQATLAAIIHSPHDGFFKGTFQSVEHAASLLQSALAPELSRHIDWGSLEQVSTEHLGEWLDKRYGDVLFRARLREFETEGDGGEPSERWVYFDVLLEHQSESQAWMNLRLLGMLVRRYEMLVRESPQLERLPLVLPVVLYQGEYGRGWRHAVQFSELLDCNAETLEAFRPYVPDFRFVLDDISQQSLDELYARQLTDLALLTLRLLRDARGNPNLLEELDNPRDLALWRRIGAAPNGAVAYQHVWVYLCSSLEAPRTKLRDFARKLGPDAQENQMTVLQELMAEGRAEGKTEGRAETLKQLLKLKFRDVEPSVFERVDRGTLEELSRWTERILTAESVEEVLG